jgi:aryl-alcohol dehydrogenase-like predicted oxidoreductase
MRYKLLGKSGLRVSELCLGTMTFGEDWGWGASNEESRKMWDAFAEAGGNFVDTSVNYTNGTSESFVGEFLAADRDHFVVATKYSLSTRRDDPNFGGNHRKNMVLSLEKSLKRLGTDYIDLYWLHMWDFTTPIEEIMRALEDVVRAGKVLHLGISDSPSWVAAQANTIATLRGWSPFVALQVPYSLASRDVERDLLPMARAFEMAVTPWAIMGGGVLTGKYNTDNGEPTRYDREGVGPKGRTLAEEVMQVAQEVGRTPAQVAINWVRQQQARGLIIPILGARTEAQLRDNLASVEWELTPEQLQRLDAANPSAPGFPISFLTSDDVRELVFGDTFALLDTHRH